MGGLGVISPGVGVVSSEGGVGTIMPGHISPGQFTVEPKSVTCK